MLVCLVCLTIFDGTDPEGAVCPNCGSRDLDHHREQPV